MLDLPAVRSAPKPRELRLDNVSKVFPVSGRSLTILDRVSFVVKPGERVGILGRNGSGKSTMIRIMGGATLPSSGHVHRGFSVSWPLAFGGAFQGSLTGLDNVRFLCRIYGVDLATVQPAVEEFAELGEYFREPVKGYSSGMRSRLAFGMSMAIDFDCVLIDEVITVGDARFRERCRNALFDKRRNRAIVVVSHEESVVKDHCDRAAVLVSGRLHEFATTDEAFDFYRNSMSL